MIEIEIHDDEPRPDLPDDAYEVLDSCIGVHWTRIRITDPRWITWYQLTSCEPHDPESLKRA